MTLYILNKLQCSINITFIGTGKSETVLFALLQH